MKTLARIVGTLLAVATGVIMYDLAVREGLVMQFGWLLVLLGAQFAAGWLLGLLMHSWRTLIAVPAAFAAGFIVAEPLRANDLMPYGISTQFATSTQSDQVTALAGGNFVLATAFLLAFLCCLLVLGVALGTTRGICIERHNAWLRAQARAALLHSRAAQQSAARTAASRELAHASR